MASPNQLSKHTYASTTHQTFTTTLTVARDQPQVTLHFPWPAIASLSNPSPVSTTQSVSTRTEIIGIVVNSNNEAFTSAAQSQVPPSEITALSQNYKVVDVIVKDGRECSAWRCWAPSAIAGVTAAIVLVGITVLILVWWSLGCPGCRVNLAKKRRKMARRQRMRDLESQLFELRSFRSPSTSSNSSRNLPTVNFRARPSTPRPRRPGVRVSSATGPAGFFVFEPRNPQDSNGRSRPVKFQRNGMAGGSRNSETFVMPPPLREAGDGQPRAGRGIRAKSTHLNVHRRSRHGRARESPRLVIAKQQASRSRDRSLGHRIKKKTKANKKRRDWGPWLMMLPFLPDFVNFGREPKAGWEQFHKGPKQTQRRRLKSSSLEPAIRERQREREREQSRDPRYVSTEAPVHLMSGGRSPGSETSSDEVVRQNIFTNKGRGNAKWLPSQTSSPASRTSPIEHTMRHSQLCEGVTHTKSREYPLIAGRHQEADKTQEGLSAIYKKRQNSEDRQQSGQEVDLPQLRVRRASISNQQTHNQVEGIDWYLRRKNEGRIEATNNRKLSNRVAFRTQVSLIPTPNQPERNHEQLIDALSGPLIED